MWLQRSADVVMVGERLPRSSSPHSHCVMQLTIGLFAPVRARIAGHVVPDASGMLIDANVAHEVAGDLVHLFVDPQSQTGRAWRGMLRAQPYLPLSREVVAQFLSGQGEDAWLDGRASGGAVESLMQAMQREHGRSMAAPFDERVANVIQLLRGRLDARTPLEELADLAHLSPSRLTHLFTREVGMPIKQYVVWLRLVAVIDAIARDKSLGTLAVASGFPDQAAFTRSYRRAWGRTPTSFRQAAAL
ncbi:MAG: AraC family transcriptional regulator [Polyangiales bacterium]